MKKRDIITLIVLTIIFLLIFAIVMLNNNQGEDKKNKTEYDKLSLVTDESVFLSVSNSINKICEYSNNNISLNFIMKNDIEKKEYKNLTFKAEEISVISKLNLYKYYIKGNFYTDMMNQISEYVKTDYFILNYDINNSSYNIEKITEEKYNNALNDNYIFETINPNDYNRFKFQNLSPKSRASMYFYDFINKIYYDTEKAYELLADESKINHFNTFEEFNNNYKNKNISMTEFSVEDNQIGIKDNYGNEYIFEIAYIMKYIVTINQAEEVN